jgi:hypothetical protein
MHDIAPGHWLVMVQAMRTLLSGGGTGPALDEALESAGFAGASLHDGACHAGRASSGSSPALSYASPKSVCATNCIVPAMPSHKGGPLHGPGGLGAVVVLAEVPAPGSPPHALEEPPGLV